MDKLTYRLHQIATFSLSFPKTPVLATFDAKMAIWLYGHMAIIVSNSHIAILPYWPLSWPFWVFWEKAVKMWQSCEDGKAIWPSCLKWEQKWPYGIFSLVFLESFLCKRKRWCSNKTVQKMAICHKTKCSYIRSKSQVVTKNLPGYLMFWQRI